MKHLLFTLSLLFTFSSFSQEIGVGLSANFPSYGISGKVKFDDNHAGQVIYGAFGTLSNISGNDGVTFNDLANNVFENCNYLKKIHYIPTPKEIRDQYQYFTKADITKLRESGYKESFFSLENGIKDYIRNYLI